MKALRTIGLIAAAEVGGSIRSRRFLVVTFVCMLMVAGGTGVFALVLAEMENAAAEAMATATVKTPGAMSQRLLESESGRRLIEALVGDADLATELSSMSPLALFYGWLVFALLPMLAVISSSSSMATPLGTGAARFALFRVERLHWAAGKLLGQAAVTSLAVYLGVFAALGTGKLTLAHFDTWHALSDLLHLSTRSLPYGFAYLGLATGVSPWVRNGWAAMGLSLAALALLLALRLGLGWLDGYLPGTNDALAFLFPASHRLNLWRPDLTDWAPAATVLTALGLGYFLIGYARLAGDDT